MKTTSLSVLARLRAETPAGWLDRHRLAQSLIVGLAVAAIARSTAARRTSARNLTPIEAHTFYASQSDHEQEDRRAAATRFRASRWSQEDEFFAQQAKHVREYAATHGVGVSALLDTFDVGMHEHWPNDSHTTPVPTVLPCRPRLEY